MCDLKKHGPFLVDLKLYSFKVIYNKSSFRGRDRGFHLGDLPKLYKFVKPSTSTMVTAPKHLQICYRHELHIANQSLQCQYKEDEIKELYSIISKLIPEGIGLNITLNGIYTRSTTNQQVAVFMIVYHGISLPLTRELADECRRRVEEEMALLVKLRDNRKGRLVSKPFPYPLLQTIIEDANF